MAHGKRLFGYFNRHSPEICSSVKEWCLRQGKGPVKVLRQSFVWNVPLPVGVLPVPSQFSSVSEVRVPEKYLVTLQGCRITGYDGFLVLPDGSFCQEAAWLEFLLTKHPAYYQRWNFAHLRQIKIKGPVYSLMSIWCREHYHWIHDALLGLFLVKECLPPETRFVIPHGLKHYQEQALEVLGISRKQCIVFDGKSDLFPEQLWFAPPTVFTGFDEPDSIKWLSSILLKDRQKTNLGTKRIYISRRNALFRRISNENEISQLLKSFGFEEVVLDDTMDLNHRIELFSNAGVVLSVHGAAMMNLMFCRPDTKVIEIFEETNIRPYYWVMATTKHLDYQFLIGKTDTSAKAAEADIYVSPESLKEALQTL